MSTTEPTLLTLQEAADAVGCHYQTLYKRVRSGELPALVAGGSYRISRADLDAWLHERDAAKGAVPERAERDWPRQIDYPPDRRVFLSLLNLSGCQHEHIFRYYLFLAALNFCSV